MIVSWKPYNKNDYIKFGTCSFEIVEDYTYFSTLLMSKRELKWVMQKRIRNASRAYYAFFLY